MIRHVTVSDQQADYIVSKIGSVITAKARGGSGFDDYSGTDAYTVIQAAINALTPVGLVGTGGGKIFICKGIYSLSNELVVAGWEGGAQPFSELIIEGEGKQTVLQQDTLGKNGLVIKNAAPLSLFNLRFGAVPTARSCIFGDKTGLNDEASVYRAYWNNIICENESTSYPAVYLINPSDLTIGHLRAHAVGNTGLVLENDSITNNFGNCHFGMLRLGGSDTLPHAGMAIRSVNSTKFINLCSFGNVQVDGSGYYGIVTSYARECSFNRVGLENVQVPIGLGVLGATSSNLTMGFTFHAGYLLPNTGGTAIQCSAYTGGNRFNNMLLEVDATAIPILDESEFYAPNSYDVNLGWSGTESSIDITNKATELTLKSYFDYKTRSYLPDNFSQDSLVNQWKSLGSAIKGFSIGITYLHDGIYGQGPDPNGINYQAIYLSQPTLITGAKIIMHTQGAYTAGTYNGVGLYSVSGNTLTKVASSTNDGIIWKAASNSLITKAFATPYFAKPGLYYLAMQYQHAGQTTAPLFASAGAGIGVALTLDFSNSRKLHGIGYNDISLPTTKDSTIDFAGSDPVWAGIY